MFCDNHVNRPSEYCQGDSYAWWTSSNQISKGMSDADKGVKAIRRGEERGKPESKRRNSSGYKPKNECGAIGSLLKLVARITRQPVQPPEKKNCRAHINYRLSNFLQKIDISGKSDLRL